LIEKYGSGIRRIIAYFDEAKLPRPEFRNISEGFMVTIFTGDKVKDTDHDTDHDTGHDTDHRKDIIIKEIAKNNKISVVKLAQLCNVSKSTILRNLNRLKKSGLLNRVGTEKNGHWEIVNMNDTNYTN
jgi:ATP-dependent DNA helicase RecG